MAQFLGDIAFLLELGLVASGLVLLHAGRERGASLWRAAGWLLVVGATATALCTSYFWFRYQAAGDFDHASGPPVTAPLAQADAAATAEEGSRAFEHERWRRPPRP